MEIIKLVQKILLIDIIKSLSQNHNSWKNSDIYNVPTTNTIADNVNNLIKRGSFVKFHS